LTASPQEIYCRLVKLEFLAAISWTGLHPTVTVESGVSLYLYQTRQSKDNCHAFHQALTPLGKITH